MIRAALTIVLPLLSTPVVSAEIAISCKGESTSFDNFSRGAPTVRTRTAPDQIFIFDEEKQLAWRWLGPLNKRDPMCDDPSCIKTFTHSTVDLFWQPQVDTVQWEWGLKLDRLTGHAVWYHQFSRANEMRYDRLDMMCSPTAVPQPS